ncbi:MAG TPA: c-type cytochrome [Patescibacteria group bacterium]|nr:c-type cytochrome [Patescibacteria group bacterium]
MRMLVAVVLAWCASAASAGGYPGIGRAATQAEIKAWDIDVRPDFVGLPPGSGSVADGEMLWIEKCSSCHGDFGDANHVFPPLIGNTTLQDIETGRVAALKEGGTTRTTIMKMPTVSTLWDFIHRAMPWDKPKSLKPDEVYAVLAYLLNLAEIVPADFVLSEKTMAYAQSRMPNRNGMTRDHGMWDIDGKPDTANKACMKNCRPTVEVSSALPDFAKAAHGELLKQNREYGAIRGTRTMPETKDEAVEEVSKVPTAPLTANGCLGCHGIEGKIIGPGFQQVADKYKGKADEAEYLKGRIRNGGAGTWGDVAMPPMAQLSDADLDLIVRWLIDGAPR